MNNRRNILIANDDGIQSPGIVRLAEAASNFGDVWVVAPEGQCSGMSQKLTIFNELNADSCAPNSANRSLKESRKKLKYLK